MPFCIKCGLKNVPTTKFCIRCGTLLVRKTEPAPETQNKIDSAPKFSQPVPDSSPEISSQAKLDSSPELPPRPKPNTISQIPPRPAPDPFPEMPPRPERSVPSTPWLIRNKSYLIAGSIAVLLFAGYRFYDGRAQSENLASDSSSTISSTPPSPSLAHDEPVNNPLPYEPKQQTVVEPPTSSATIEPGTDEWFKDQVARLYQAENQITNANMDLTTVLQFYAFPLERYYDAKRVDANRLVKIYTESYSGALEHHLVRDYENKMTISRKEGSNVKVIAGCNFEFSTKQSPEVIRSRSVYNVYVFNENGKIISVYQLL